MNSVPPPLRLAFAGTPDFAVPALDSLLRSPHRVVAVFTQPDRPAGRGQVLHPGPVKLRALEHGLPVLQPSTFKTAEALEMLRGLAVDALVVIAYGLILPPAVLAAPRLGCFNIHASLLPRWRGAAPIQRAVLAGDEVSGVTIMRMEAGLDTGPWLLARQVPIEARDTAGILHDRLAQLGGELIVEALQMVAAGTAVERPQPSTGITYAEKLSKTEAVIDWRETAVGIERRVRAFNPWPVAQTFYGGGQLRIWDAVAMPSPAGAAPSAGAGRVPGTVLAESSQGVDVACGEGVLRLTTLQLAGRKPLPAAEFLKGHSLQGVVFGAPVP